MKLVVIQFSCGIKDISLTIKKGSVVLITGQVGSGKTTFLQVLLGLLPKSNGKITWNGSEIKDP